MLSWKDIRSGWSDAWVHLEQQAVDAYGAAIKRSPMRYAAQVETFIRSLLGCDEALTTADAHIDEMEDANTPAAAQLRAKHSQLQDRYNGLAAGLWAHSTAADGASEPEVGLAPLAVVATVMGVGLSATGIAWAVAYNSHAVALQKESELFLADLTARVAASKDGRDLPPATIPRAPGPPGASGSGMGGAAVAVGLLGLLGLGFAVYRAQG